MPFNFINCQLTTNPYLPLLLNSYFTALACAPLLDKVLSAVMHFLMTSQSFCQLHPIHTEIIHILPDFLTQLGSLMDQTDYWFCKVELYFFFQFYCWTRNASRLVWKKDPKQLLLDVCSEHWRNLSFHVWVFFKIIYLWVSYLNVYAEPQNKTSGWRN